MNPFGYHLTNLLLHAANAVLFYFMALRLLRASMPRGHADGWPSRSAAGSRRSCFLPMPSDLALPPRPINRVLAMLAFDGGGLGGTRHRADWRLAVGHRTKTMTHGGASGRVPWRALGASLAAASSLSLALSVIRLDVKLLALGA